MISLISSFHIFLGVDCTAGLNCSCANNLLQLQALHLGTQGLNRNPLNYSKSLRLSFHSSHEPGPYCQAAERVFDTPGDAPALSNCYMGVSEIRGTLFWGPYKKDPTV